jgi:CRISPR-associated endonuclease/helicase Cas3
MAERYNGHPLSTRIRTAMAPDQAFGDLPGNRAVEQCQLDDQSGCSCARGVTNGWAVVTQCAMNFNDFVGAAAGRAPYPYQQRLAVDGLPDVLRAPTGAGKTLAAVLPWLYRRAEHPDSVVRAGTPRWLVVVLPQRALVEQTVRVVRGWVAAVAPDVGVHVLMGGESGDEHEWKTFPGRERIFVGTQDMVLSRLLMRGFAEGRTAWPMSFGLLHAGVQFVFDEVQLMGPGLPTSLQLQGLRESLGTGIPCRTMWMSATLDVAELRSVDFDRERRVVELGSEDRVGALGARLAATRTVRRLDLGDVDARRYPRALAERVLAEHLAVHRAGTRTLVVCNQVDRAVEVHRALNELLSNTSGPRPDTVVLHSRFRPADRQARTDEALAEPGAAGMVVVATQVLEAGVDLSSTTLVTEVAPWTSIVQRAGRCNRYGETGDARLLWVQPPAGKTAHLPYEPDDLTASAAALAALEGRAATGTDLAETAVEQVRVVHPVLRRRDLLGLFDTAPDLSGNDIDVSPFIRDAADRTVSVAWRAAEAMTPDAVAVAREELCPAPIAAVDRLVGAGRTAWVFDHASGEWRRAQRRDVRPSAIVVLDAAEGGYLPAVGFSERDRTPVEPVVVAADEPVGLPVPDAVDTDPLAAGTARWVSLAEHLADTEHEARALLADLGDTPGLTAIQREAIVVAAGLHDVGKAHESFQTALVKANPDNGRGTAGVWAKSPGCAVLRPDPPHFRHELVSALLLADPEFGLLDGLEERELVVYLALAHHGKVRVTVRARLDEPRGVVLGVREGDTSLAVELPHGALPATPLSLAGTGLGPESLTGRALRLRDRADLGPFRLAFAEALVRSADWRASRNPGGAGWTD